MSKVIKQTLYPKTIRIGKEETNYFITEKLDGSNIGFFVLDGELYVAQRNNVYEASIISKEFAYKGLQQFLKDHDLASEIVEGAIIFGEWLGSGRLKYPNATTRFYMFAKARIDEKLNVTNMVYTPEFYKYAFNKQEIPDFMEVVPLVDTVKNKPSILHLDALYDDYLEDVGRNVEGFVITNGSTVEKYVRNVGKGVIEYKTHARKGDRND